uniref:RRM domain-containing protein n=1 Tax=Macrostomum lignano TaxID=282301 RepID=A0A1I8FJV0_9PLAT
QVGRGSVGGGSGGGTSVDWLSPDTILSQLARKGGRASTLHSLTLRAERLTDSGVKKLTGGAGCAQLRRLHLTACHRLTDSALAGLTASAPLLHCLHIVDCPLWMQQTRTTAPPRSSRYLSAGLQRLSSGRGKDGGNAACCLRELTFAGQHRLADQAKAARVIGDIGSCLERLSLDSCSPHCTLSCDQSMLGGFQCLTPAETDGSVLHWRSGARVLAKPSHAWSCSAAPLITASRTWAQQYWPQSQSAHRTAAAASAAVSPSAAESTGLQELTLPCNLLTPKGYHSLGSLGPGLAKLCLRYCSAPVQTEAMATMPLSLTGLRHLEATASARCGGEEAALFAGLEMTRLVECCASNLRITSSGVQLRSARSRRRRRQRLCRLGPAALAKAAALLSLAELRELTLCPCDDSLTETCVAQLLRACPQLRHVSLGPDIKVSQVSIRLMIRDTNLSIVRPLIGWYLRSDTNLLPGPAASGTDTSHSTGKILLHNGQLVDLYWSEVSESETVEIGTLTAPKFNIMVKLFVGNINDPRSDMEDRLRSAFAAYGLVTECSLMRDYAFVHMDSELAARERLSGGCTAP